MPKSLPNNMLQETGKVVSTSPFIVLIELDVEGTTAFRAACNYDEEVSHLGDTYYPFPVDVSPIKRTSDGSVESISVTVSAIGGLAAIALDGGALVGRPARVIIIHDDHAGDSVEELYEIQGASLSDDTATLTLGMPSPLSQVFPTERLWRGRCRFAKEYGSGRCGYDKTLPNLISATRPNFDPTACDYTLDGGNGCRAHGENETANGAAPEHPKRFGGAPGIPKGTVLAR